MRLSGELKIIIGAALFAFIPVCVVLGKDLSVFALLFGRLLFASLILFLIEKNKKELFNISKKQFLILFGWSQLMLASMICYFFAIKFSSISVSSALLGTQPVVIILLAAILLKERISLLNVLVTLITLIGILCITGIKDIGNQTFFIGELMAISAAFFLGFNFILQKKYLEEFNGKQLVLYQGVFQLPFLIPFLLFNPGTLSTNALSAMIILAVVCTVMAYTLIYDGIRLVEAQKIGVLQSVEYVLPIVIGIVFYHETPSPINIVGMLLIIGSCVFVSFQPNKGH
jgi:drug/metabolite transporter (DMT)-like permease